MKDRNYLARLFGHPPTKLWTRRTVLGGPILLALAACTSAEPVVEEDDAVADALNSEPMWISYRPPWVESDTSRVGRRQGGNLAGPSRVMTSNRQLLGVLPADAVATARTAAVQFGWPAPGPDLWQVRSASGKGKTVTLRMFIAASDGALGIRIDGSFG